MAISVWTQSSNPAVDPSDFNIPRTWADSYVSRGEARWMGRRRIQMTIEHRLDRRAPKRLVANRDYSAIEGGTVWRVVGQCPPGGGERFSGFPSWQLVP